jgi:hypothetical protein
MIEDASSRFALVLGAHAALTRLDPQSASLMLSALSRNVLTGRSVSGKPA